MDGRVYLAMGLVDGRDLGSLLRTEGALEPDRAMAICAQIAAALDAAHARGLVHRDVKPSNVLLDSSEHVYLADFGLTRRLDDGGAAGEDRSVGTPAYLAPEQLEGGPDRRPRGRLLARLRALRVPHRRAGLPRSSRLAVAWAHLEEEPPQAEPPPSGLPEAIDTVIGRALAKEPEHRYPSCGAWSPPREALGLGTPRASRRRRTVLLAGVAAVAIATAVP